MAYASEKRWLGVSSRVTAAVVNLINNLNFVEEEYQQLLQVFTYAGGTAAGLAELLFKEDIAFRPSPDNVANAEEIAMAQDLIDAMTAAHQLYQAANNITVAQADRMTDLRRFA